jgi:1,4-alpha-glucan branching enzyme
MGWMNDSLEYISKDPIHRKYHHNDITFSMVYAFDEQFILPLSHDEVVHGKGSILGRMPGDTWQQFANLRAYYGFMWTHPGKKLMFMGCEFGQGREWNYDASLDWHLLDVDWHQGMLQLIKDLNRVYCDYGAMHQKDTEHDGFEWIDGANEEQSILAFCRYGFDKDKPLLVISNFTPTTHTNYQVGVPLAGTWREIINTDAQQYQGSGVINEGHIHSQPEPCHGREQSLRITVPPLATIILECL